MHHPKRLVVNETCSFDKGFEQPCDSARIVERNVRPGRFEAQRFSQSGEIVARQPRQQRARETQRAVGANDEWRYARASQRLRQEGKIEGRVVSYDHGVVADRAQQLD
jgi:hypothetical protein